MAVELLPAAVVAAAADSFGPDAFERPMVAVAADPTSGCTSFAVAASDCTSLAAAAAVASGCTSFDHVAFDPAAACEEASAADSSFRSVAAADSFAWRWADTDQPFVVAVAASDDDAAVAFGRTCAAAVPLASVGRSSSAAVVDSWVSSAFDLASVVAFAAAFVVSFDQAFAVAFVAAFDLAFAVASFDLAPDSDACDSSWAIELRPIERALEPDSAASALVRRSFELATDSRRSPALLLSSPWALLLARLLWALVQ